VVSVVVVLETCGSAWKGPINQTTSLTQSNRYAYVGGSPVNFIKGAFGTRTGAVRASPILPGSTVNLGLGSTKRLPAGTYKVSVSLVQDDKKVLRSTRRLRVK
jgi:hypothetical protein